MIVANTEQGHEFLLIGFPAIVPKYFGNQGIFSHHLYKIKINENTLTKEFIYYLLKSPQGREHLIGATNGSTVNMLAKSGLEELEFISPLNDRLEKFSYIIAKYWKKKKIILNNLITYRYSAILFFQNL